MKHFLILICLLPSFSGKAQVINIPDSNFKYYLVHYPYGTIDLNYDGDIQESEASAIEYLMIDNFLGDAVHLIQDISGIKSFVNLEHLDCNRLRRIRTVDFTGMDHLTLLNVYQNDSLVSVNVNGCTGLDTFWCQDNRLLSSLDVSSCTNLKIFNCSGNNLDHLRMGTLDSLKDFDCSRNSLDTMDLRACKNLRSFYANMAKIRYANLNGLNKLEGLYIADVIGETFLEELYLENCSKLSAPTLTDVTKLRRLVLTGCTALSGLNMSGGNLIQDLDLSTCPNISNIYFWGRSLKNLNLKNGGITSALYLDRQYNNPDSLNICADDFEIETLNMQSDIRNTPVNVNSYCSFFPGGNYNSILGTIKIDADNNGCDVNDEGMGEVPIKITDNLGNIYTRFTAPNGGYGLYPYKGSFSLAPYFPYPWFTISPSSTTVIFDTTNNLTETRNFCINANGIHNDLEITILPAWPPARPGTFAGYTLTYKNRGTTTLSGNVQLNFDNSKMNFITASENVTAQSTVQLVWNYNNLQPFESRMINITFNLLPPPVNNIGDTITYLAAITPSANDETAFDNSFILPQRIRGAMDPNDKHCLEGSKLDISKIGEYLHYQVHFQNEGTDTAFNIVVVDTLSDKLDWNTLEMISSSHPCAVNIKNNKAEFIFENIKLPYKAINEPASNGYVAFKIKPKPSVIVGDSLNNTAAIYFDFNLPVITNRATTVVTNASIPVTVKLEYFNAAKKENSNLLSWKASCSNEHPAFDIERSEDAIHFKPIGNITPTPVRCQLPFSFTDNDPLPGKNYYRLKITDADGIFFYSKILLVENNKTGLEIVAIANNTAYLNSNKQQTIEMKLIAADGRQVAGERKYIFAGNNRVELNLKTLARGAYTLVICTPGGKIVTKAFIK